VNKEGRGEPPLPQEKYQGIELEKLQSLLNKKKGERKDKIRMKKRNETSNLQRQAGRRG